MDVKELLGRLQGVRGPNGSGEYTAKCPAHEDRTASLTVREKESPKDGKRRIYLSCHAGCSGTSVMEALGVTPRDLIVDPDTGDEWKRRGAAKTQRPDFCRKGADHGYSYDDYKPILWALHV